MIHSIIVLFYHLTLVLETAGGQIAGPCQNLHFGILIDGVTLAGGQRNHVTSRVRTVLDKLGVQEVGFLCGHETTHTAVQDHVSIHELDRDEAQIRVTRRGETLDRLQGGHVHAPVSVIDHDQVRTILTPNQLGPERVEILLDVGSGRCGAAIGRCIDVWLRQKVQVARSMPPTMPVAGEVAT